MDIHLPSLGWSQGDMEGSPLLLLMFFQPEKEINGVKAGLQAEVMHLESCSFCYPHEEKIYFSIVV